MGVNVIEWCLCISSFMFSVFFSVDICWFMVDCVRYRLLVVSVMFMCWFIVMKLCNKFREVN